MIETLRTGSAPSVSMPTIAWPASWYAVRLRSSTVIITCRSAPSTIRSSASVKSASATVSWFRRAASSAASLTRFARSAPTMPGVVAAIRVRSTSESSGTPRVCSVRLAGNGSREQRLARAGQTGEQDAVRNAAPQLLVLVGVTQEVDDLRQLRLRLLDACDIGEGDLVARGLIPPRARAAKRAQDVLDVACPPHQPEQQDDEHDRRPEAEQEVLPPRRPGVERLRVDDDAFLLEQA